MPSFAPIQIVPDLTDQALLQQAGAREMVWVEPEAILKAINRGDAQRAERLARRRGEEVGYHFRQELDRHVREAS